MKKWFFTFGIGLGILAAIQGLSGSARGEVQHAVRSLSTAVLQAQDQECGEKILPPKVYEQASLYSLIAGFTLVIAGILIDRKPVKFAVWGLALVPLVIWVYVHFFVDFERIKRLTFTYNVLAEGALANIAEAQDRYKSEHDQYLSDLDKLYSHMAGSHGIDPCVRILKIEADWNHWSAVAKHVSSPEKITWDSQTGSSLKKG